MQAIKKASKQIETYFNFVSYKQSFILCCLLLVSFIFIVLAITLGSYGLSVIEFIKGNTTSIQNTVLIEIRLPRVILSAIVGASLGISGASLQGLFRNPLADPGLIGVSAGAALGATLIIVLGGDLFDQSTLGIYLIPLAAVAGASLVIFML